MVRSAGEWPWSSYRSTAGMISAPNWLQVDWLLSCFARRKNFAMGKYRHFVLEGKGLTSLWGQLRHQIYLGDDAFVKEMQSRVEPDTDLSEIPSIQKRKLAKPIADYIAKASTRNEGIYLACQSGGYSMKAIADTIGLHYSSVSKVLKDYDNARFKT